jgi:5-(carboxyamino)imidazole ribonucleotide synthase
MLAEPAAAMGVPLRLLAEAEGVSAAQVIPDHVVGDYTDLATLQRVVKGCEVVTFDHEHVPTGHLHRLERELAVRPGPDALVHAQDKGVMRERLGALGVRCPRNAIVTSAEDVAAFGFPCVLKATRGGYDGKGVWFAASAEECAPAFETAVETAAGSGVRILAVELVVFRRELSALVARSPSGQVAAYPVVQSTQADGICREVVAPAPGLDDELALQAQRIAMRIATELGVTGILAVELFETVDGRVLVNELAMRPHNTGHWTQDGAVTSQFENHLRAVLDLPLGVPDAREPWTVMVNILGGPVDAGRLYDGYPHVLARDPRLKVHLYGKDVKPGRKVGHVTAYGDDLEEVRERALHAAACRARSRTSSRSSPYAVTWPTLRPGFTSLPYRCTLRNGSRANTCG